MREPNNQLSRGTVRQSVLWLPWIGFALVLLLGVVRSAAQTGTQHEYDLKAGVLYHIIEYVEWPTEAMSNNPTALQIGLIGTYSNALGVLSGKIVKGRKLIVTGISDPQAAATCQVLFIGASEQTRISEIVTQLKDRPILTVSEVPGLAEQGVMVNLVPGQNRIIMEINREVAGRARLSMSSQLLKLAKVFPRS